MQTGAWRRKKWLRYVSRAFIIPKPGLDAKGRKQYRLIVDLRPLNLHCDEFKTRYETLFRSIVSRPSVSSHLSVNDASSRAQIRPIRL